MSKIHVKPWQGEWKVQKENSQRASAITNTKEEALSIARDIAINQNLIMVIHGKDGRIQRTISPQQIRDEGDNCFLTTACVNYYGLPDSNCYLNTLRDFRDHYLFTTNQGKILVKQYYLIAPLLVSLIESDNNRSILYENILQKIIKACEAIKRKRFKQASLIYQSAVIGLLDYFKIR